MLVYLGVSWLASPCPLARWLFISFRPLQGTGVDLS